MKSLHYVTERTKNLFKVLYLVTGLLTLIGIITISILADLHHASLAWNVVIILVSALIIMGLTSYLEYLNLRNKREYEKEYALVCKTKVVEIRVMQCPARQHQCQQQCKHARPHLKIKDCEVLGCHELANSFYTVK